MRIALLPIALLLLTGCVGRNDVTLGRDAAATYPAMSGHSPQQSPSPATLPAEPATRPATVPTRR